MPPDKRRISRWIGWILALYWLAMFSGTHYPKAPEVAMGANDKVLHFSGYMGLAFLLTVWRSFDKRIGWLRLTGILAIVMAYGACDEITQIPVGRDCDLVDWLADTAGAILGVGLATGMLSLWRRDRPQAGEATG